MLCCIAMFTVLLFTWNHSLYKLLFSLQPTYSSLFRYSSVMRMFRLHQICKFGIEIWHVQRNAVSYEGEQAIFYAFCISRNKCLWLVWHMTATQTLLHLKNLFHDSFREKQNKHWHIVDLLSLFIKWHWVAQLHGVLQRTWSRGRECLPHINGLVVKSWASFMASSWTMCTWQMQTSCW